MSFWGGMWTLTPVFCRRAAHVMYHDTITIYTYIWIYSCYKVFCIWSLLCEKFVFNSFYDVKNEVVLTIVKIEFIKERKIILLLIFWKKLLVKSFRKWSAWKRWEIKSYTCTVGILMSNLLCTCTLCVLYVNKSLALLVGWLAIHIWTDMTANSVRFGTDKILYWANQCLIWR